MFEGHGGEAMEAVPLQCPKVVVEDCPRAFCLNFFWNWMHRVTMKTVY